MQHPAGEPSPDTSPPSGASDGELRRPFAVRVTRSAAELVADRLLQAGASAVAERDVDGDGDDRDRVELVADLAPQVAESLRDRDALALRELEPVPPIPRPVEARRVGDWLLLLPAEGEPTARTGRLVMRLAAGSLDGGVEAGSGVGGGEVFGAGSHPSTRTCLAALEPLAPNAARVLDVGSGTGVLAVAALLLGSASGVAVDIDTDAVRATARTAELNGVADRLAVHAGSVEAAAGQADLVVANLLLPTIEELGADLVNRVAPGGHLVIGGVLDGQVDRVLAAATPMDLLATQHEGRWVACVLGPR